MKRSWTLVAVLVASSPGARAEPTAPERALARTLFEEARIAMRDKQYDGACPKLEESQRLDPGIGTLYHLADCYEGLGRVASAWTTFADVADLCRRAGQRDREEVARARASSLEARLPHVRVEVAPGDAAASAPAARLSFTLDGAPFAAELVASAAPVDPGEHELAVTVDGRRRYARRFRVEEGKEIVVTVPTLEPEVEPVVSTPPVKPPPEPAPDVGETAPRRTWQMPLALTAGGLAVVTAGVGTALGILAMEDWSTAKPECVGGCSAQGYSAWHAAHGLGIASTATFCAAGSLLAAGAVLWFTRPGPVRVGVRASGALVLEGKVP